MRCLERNKTTIHYALFLSKEADKDEYGNESGEPIIAYTDPIELRANVSPATGASQIEQFGNSVKYDKVIIFDDVALPIDENTVFFVDKPPTRDAEGNLLFDYVVKMIAKSLNSIAIAISKVELS